MMMWLKTEYADVLFDIVAENADYPISDERVRYLIDEGYLTVEENKAVPTEKGRIFITGRP